MDERRRVPEGYPHGPAAALVAHGAVELPEDVRVVVLVEGVSDRIAVETLARRLGVELADAAVLPTGGVHGLGAMIRAVREAHAAAALVGLYDVAEADVVRRALTAQRLVDADRATEEAGFFACTADLEDELVRACGADLVQACLEAHGDLPAFRRLQRMPQWRDRPVQAQLRRWLASGARRKLRYARILIEAAPADRVPAPLRSLIERIASATGP